MPSQPPLPLELILRPEVQRLLDHFAAVMKVRAVFFAADGTPLDDGRRQEGNCDYCRLIQQRFHARRQCHYLDARMQQASLRSRQIECYVCHAGLGEMIAPVFAEGQIAGYIMIGQFRPRAARPPVFADETLQAAWEQLPGFSEAELDDLKGLFHMLVDYIVTRELVGWRGDRRRELIEHYLDKHLCDDIRLAQLARYAGCSVSGLTHWLREHFHCSFKQLLTGKRLNRAEQLLRRHPELSIGEIAAATGFQDNHYFSRVFRQRRGCTPSEWRRTAISKDKCGNSYKNSADLDQTFYPE